MLRVTFHSNACQTPIQVESKLYDPNQDSHTRCSSKTIVPLYAPSFITDEDFKETNIHTQLLNSPRSAESTAIETSHNRDNKISFAEKFQMFPPRERNIVIPKKEIEKTKSIGEKGSVKQKATYFQNLSKNQM